MRSNDRGECLEPQYQTNGEDETPRQGPSEGPSTDMDEFVRLFASHQRTIFLYLSALLPTRVDVDDVFQETSLVCWREFSRFKLGTNFGAWACTIAFNRVRAWRTKRSRQTIFFSDDFVKAVSDELIDHADKYDGRIEALGKCVDKLPSHHRELLRHRYDAESSIEEIAQRVDRSSDAVYRMLSRIRHVLHDCVNRTISAQEQVT